MLFAKHFTIWLLNVTCFPNRSSILPQLKLLIVVNKPVGKHSKVGDCSVLGWKWQQPTGSSQTAPETLYSMSLNGCYHYLPCTATAPCAPCQHLLQSTVQKISHIEVSGHLGDHRVKAPPACRQRWLSLDQPRGPRSRGDRNDLASG